MTENIYIVKNNVTAEESYVKASSPNQVLRSLIGDQYSINKATAKELTKMIGNNDVEIADLCVDDDQQEPTLED